MSVNKHDLVVIGTGPGGYVAAIRAAQLGMDVACIEDHAALGGTCARVGCIPSKALLESTHQYVKAKHHLAPHGIEVGDVSFDLSKMHRRKNDIVSTLTGGVRALLKKNKIKVYLGRGRLEDPHTIVVSNGNGNGNGNGDIHVRADRILIATGSKPATLPGVELDYDRIGDSTTALSYAEVPKRLIVIGAGVIGLELGSVWNRLGAEVVFLEALGHILPGTDPEICRIAQRIFEKQGLTFKVDSWVQGATVEDGQCVVRLKGADSMEADRVLLCTGRVPNTRDMGLEDLGVRLDRRGFVIVDSKYSTSVEGIFAIGDCIGGMMLAHKASEEGIACVEMMATSAGNVHYDAIPSVVYTWPEVAWVGKTEPELKDEEIEFHKGICPFGANARARALGEVDGRVKILADARTDRILGVHAIGAFAGDLMAEASAAITFGASAEDLARTCHAHPTLSEMLGEAAMAVDKRAIHTA